MKKSTKSPAYWSKPEIRYQYSNKTCLRCQRVFKSEGSWNRICQPCKKDQNFKQSLYLFQK